MITTFTLNDAMIGQMIGAVRDGFINRFELQTSPWPAWQADGFQATPYPFGTFAGGGRLVLRDGDGKGVRLINFNPTFLAGPTPVMLNTSCRFFGGLMLESCPRGASYRLDISDLPVTRAQWAA